MGKVAIIGGTGFYGLLGEPKEVETPFGRVEYSEYEGVIFVSRHGDPPVPPHRVNYKAKLYALYKLGVERIVGISAVGSLRENLAPGTIVIPHQLIDFTGVLTYYDDEVFHVDMTEPFCPVLRKLLSEEAGVPAGGVYVTVPGPRFETAAEANMYRMLGGDVLGMTVGKEAKLARELGLCYQPITLVTNYVADPRGVSHEEHIRMMQEKGKKMTEYALAALRRVPESREGCPSVRYYGRLKL
ncbi:MAG: phosphoglycerate transporter [Thermoplasmata archaeon]|nr:MAG: phosphoglycerate transporter [Thermoplasmata archaeon]HDJ26954.1 phosphoglycerate transporter [Aciduliprofundum sp.]